MIISQADNRLNEASAFLENATFLTDSESAYLPQMVTIVENSRLGYNLIRLEDFLDYTMTNGITEATYGLEKVCEANGIDPSTIGFSVDEVSLLEDSDMYDTAVALQESNFPVYASPEPATSISYILTEAVLDTAIQYNEDDMNTILEAYLEDDIDTLQEAGVFDAISDKAQSLRRSASDVIDRVKSTMVQSKDKSRKWIAKKISSLKSLGNQWMSKAASIPGKGKEVAKGVVNKINSCISYLGKKLRSAF